MIFTRTPLGGAYLIGLERRGDDRGFFARAFCAQEFAKHGLETTYVQANLSRTAKAGVVRGMHFQNAPFSEVKLVRCLEGAIYDVIVDNRPDSPTFRQSFGAELSAENGQMMYVPRGFAHGYQALTDGALVHYMVSAFYAPDAEGGLRHDDPKLAIAWPRAITETSAKDATWPLIDSVGT